AMDAAAGADPNGAGAAANAEAQGSSGSTCPGTGSRGPRAAYTGIAPNAPGRAGRRLGSKAPVPLSEGGWAAGPRALPPRIANEGPPGWAPNCAICRAAAPRLTSGCEFRVAAHWLLHCGLEKNAKLTVFGCAGRLIAVGPRPIAGTGPDASKRQIAAVYQSVHPPPTTVPQPSPPPVPLPP